MHVKIDRVFLITVLIPTALATIYFGFISSDIYVSESKFVVRSPERQTASPLGSLLKGSGFSRSQDDSYTVQDFILSRDALKKVSQYIDARAAYSNPSIDLFSRFSGLDFDDSFEALHRYYQKKIDIQLDSLSSITTLTVRGFTAESVFQMNQRLLELSEALVNELNERGRQDMIRFASIEVEQAERKASAAAMALSGYRNQQGVIDPERQSVIPLQQIAKLQDELLATKTQLAQLTQLTKDNPQIPALKTRQKLLQSEIDAETHRVTGGEKSLSSKAADFQRLALEREFADKQLATALSSLVQARNEAQRKQLYLERIVQPSQPDKAMEPRRLRAVAAVFVLGLIAWGVLTMLIAGIKEHQD